MKSVAFLALATTLLASVSARTINLKAGDDYELMCLHEVEAGDTCYLEKGDYKHDGLTVTHGTKNKRITITGHSQACIKGSNNQDRVLQIAHDYYTIKNICFDGKHNNDFAETAIYVLGADRKTNKGVNGDKSSVTGLQMFDLEIKNFNSECVHFRYFVTDAEVQGCTIQKCGKNAFENGGGGKVGEAIYVGTALDQVKDNKAPEVKIRTGSADNVSADVCTNNWIHHNTFRTYGNECVDVKEGSTGNLIEYNVCEQQKDPNSGGFGLRGSENTVRYNKIAECVGAGIRVGGDKHYGKGNHLYGNSIKNVDYGAFNVMAGSPGSICENKISGVDVVAQGEYKDINEFSAEAVAADCGFSSSTHDLDGFATSSPSEDSGDDDEDDDEEESIETIDEDDEEVGVNFSDGVDDTPVITEIGNNESAGGDGMGGCAVVLEVAKFKSEHESYQDSNTSPESLFDNNIGTYYSVNRETTKFTMELEDETEINGISIGFFMKSKNENRIQTFDIATRKAGDTDWTTVISREESSGEMDVMQTFTFTSRKALYIRFESHGNDYNNWTALTELEVCGKTASGSNALFGGVKQAVGHELQELAGEVCTAPKKLAPKRVTTSGRENVSVIFDGNFETRWATQNTGNVNDLDNDKIMMMYQGDMNISKIKLAFFDGHLAKPHFSVYCQKAKDSVWTPIFEQKIGAQTEQFQTFNIDYIGCNQMYIVGNGNDVGDYTKVSEVEVYGC